jgi:hypothetical protein
LPATQAVNKKANTKRCFSSLSQWYIYAHIWRRSHWHSIINDSTLLLIAWKPHAVKEKDAADFLLPMGWPFSLMAAADAAWRCVYCARAVAVRVYGYRQLAGFGDKSWLTASINHREAT